MLRTHPSAEWITLRAFIQAFSPLKRGGQHLSTWEETGWWAYSEAGRGVLVVVQWLARSWLLIKNSLLSARNTSLSGIESKWWNEWSLIYDLRFTICDLWFKWPPPLCPFKTLQRRGVFLTAQTPNLHFILQNSSIVFIKQPFNSW